MKNNPIKDRSFKFSLSIIKLYKKLQGNNEFVISKQLLRCQASLLCKCLKPLIGALITLSPPLFLGMVNSVYFPLSGNPY